MPHLKFATVVLPCLVAVGLSLASTAADVNATGLLKSIGFNKDIRPILADNCITCHGPDSAARQAGLRLDRRDGLVAKRILVPGNPAASVLMQRINAHGALQMPPASRSRKLSPALALTMLALTGCATKPLEVRAAAPICPGPLPLPDSLKHKPVLPSWLPSPAPISTPAL